MNNNDFIEQVQIDEKIPTNRTIKTDIKKLRQLKHTILEIAQLTGLSMYKVNKILKEV